MDPSNFTPISNQRSSKKKSSLIKTILSAGVFLVLTVGIFTSYIFVNQGFSFQPRASSRGGHLTQYGWNGTCFTKLSTIKYAARYQCPGKIGSYAKGCDPKHGGRRTGYWKPEDIRVMVRNGKSQVCIIPNGSTTPKDSSGCFTQQLDIDTGNGGGPEGWYSFDKCVTVTPTPTLTPTVTPSVTPTGTLTPTPTPTPTIVCPKPEKPNVRITCPLCNIRSSTTQ